MIECFTTLIPSFIRRTGPLLMPHYDNTTLLTILHFTKLITLLSPLEQSISIRITPASTMGTLGISHHQREMIDEDLVSGAWSSNYNAQLSHTPPLSILRHYASLLAWPHAAAMTLRNTFAIIISFYDKNFYATTY